MSNNINANDYTSWYDSVYPRLTDHGLWLRGGELNTVPREEFEKRFFKVLFVRLSTYSDVASSFSHLLLYQIAASLPEVFPDIAYLPPENDAKMFEKDSVPWLLGTQTKAGPGRFSFIGFSNSIVQELLNIPRFLMTSGIPLARNERMEREDVPILVLGGSNALFSSAIWGDSSPVDGIFLGGDASNIREFLRIAAIAKKEGKPKREILKELESVEGFFPSDNIKGRTRRKTFLWGHQETLEKGPVPYEGEAIGVGHLQITEGCRALCGFCAENWQGKPFRELKEKELIRKALNMKTEMGIEEMELASFNFNMHSKFYPLLWEMLPLFRGLGLKSQRFDMLSFAPEMVEVQRAVGKTTFSAGLEGISPRLRRYLNKNLREDALYKSLELMFRAGARELKIFLVSTGMEEDDDFRQFDALLAKIKQYKERSRVGTRVVFSVTPLVRFPWTPLEFGPAYSAEVHEAVAGRIKKSCEVYSFEAREAMDAKEYLISQVLVRSSEGGIYKTLLKALAATSFTYYSRVTPRFFSSFVSALEKEGVSLNAVLSAFTLEESMKKPWAGIETGVKRRFLWEVYRKNCDFSEIGTGFNKVNVEKPPFPAGEYKERALETVKNAAEKSLIMNIGERGKGLPRKYLGLVLARAIMKSEKTLVPYFRSYASSYWSRGGEKYTRITGDDIVTLLWDKKALPLLEKKLIDKKFLATVNTHLDGWGSVRTGDVPEAPGFSLTVESPYAFDGTAYFRERGINYVQHKDKAMSYRLEFPVKSLKKQIVSEFSYSSVASVDGKSRFFVNIVSGPKFNVEEFIREAFRCPDKNDRVRILVSSRILN